MALLFLDSFDHYLNADILQKWSEWNTNSPGVTAGAGRNSSKGFRGDGSSRYVAKITSSASLTVIAGFAIKSNATAQVICNIGDSVRGHLGLQVTGAGALAVHGITYTNRQWMETGALGTVICTSAAGVVTAGAYVHVEIKATIADSPSGSVEVRLNGATVASATGVDTRNGGTPLANYVYLGGNADIDDVYICDDVGPAPWNTFLGDCRVDVRLPTAEGALSAWTPLSGTDNALMVDDPTPDGDSTYNATSTVGATDTHVVQDAPVVGATILGIQFVISQRKTDAGTCSVAPVVRHGTTNYPGSAINPGTTYAYTLIPYSTNPGTSAAWVEADFNAAQFGYTRTA